MPQKRSTGNFQPFSDCIIKYVLSQKPFSCLWLKLPTSVWISWKRKVFLRQKAHFTVEGEGFRNTNRREVLRDVKETACSYPLQSLHICMPTAWPDGRAFSDVVLSILQFTDFFSRLFSVVMEGFASPPPQLLMLPGGSQWVLPGSKGHLNLSDWDCVYLYRETCETSQWNFGYEELGTVFGSGLWKHPDLVWGWDGAESVPEPLQAPSAPNWTSKLSALMSGLCFQSDLYALSGQSFSKLSANVFCISV